MAIPSNSSRLANLEMSSPKTKAPQLPLIKAYYLANGIDLKEWRAAFTGKLIMWDADEVFYTLKEGQYVYVFSYGVVSFFNTSQEEQQLHLKRLQPFLKEPVAIGTFEEQVVVNSQHANAVVDGILEINFNEITALQIAMLHVAQSTALDHYGQMADALLNETTQFTNQLEAKGTLKLKGKKLRKFIGRALNLKNKITEHLYVFESHEMTWEEQHLDRLDQQMKHHFDLKDRFEQLSDKLDVVKENLALFKDMMHHRESSWLEWIIILLILVEVIDLFVSKIFI